MTEKAKKKMRRCFWCGEELGMFTDAESDPLDTCGKPECDREARNQVSWEREEAHKKLDRERGWD